MYVIIIIIILRYINKVWIYPQQLYYIESRKHISHPHNREVRVLDCLRKVSFYDTTSKLELLK